MGNTIYFQSKCFIYLIFGKKFFEQKFDLETALGSKRFENVERISKLIVGVFPLFIYTIGVLEIFIWGKIHIFYLLLPLLLIPLLWKGYLYTFSEYCFAVIRPGAYPGFTITYVDNSGKNVTINLMDISKYAGKDKKTNTMDLKIMPDSETQKLYSEVEIEDKIRYYLICFYYYNLSMNLREKNTKILEKYSKIFSILKLLISIRLLYDINDFLPSKLKK
jgi:hypothetical protein